VNVLIGFVSPGQIKPWILLNHLPDVHRNWHHDPVIGGFKHHLLQFQVNLIVIQNFMVKVKRLVRRQWLL
jgi:hypothetical protein